LNGLCEAEVLANDPTKIAHSPERIGVVIAVNPAESFHGASMKMKHILEPSLLPSTHAKHIHYLQGFELSPGEKWEEPGSER